MKIDIVYTWVDGSDPAWQERRARVLGAAGEVHPVANCVARFADNGELRYSLRSVFSFAPWVNRIYIVSDGQVPAWLDLQHPKIKLIEHEAIFSRSDCLPTFNGRAIEACIHNIEGLAEHFIYFNDDMFLGRPVSPGDFFSKKGLPRVFTTTRFPKSKLQGDLVRQGDGALHLAGIRESRRLVEQVTGKKVCYDIRHQVKPILRDTMRHAACESYKEQFDAVASARFRGVGQVLPSHCTQFHAIATGMAAPTYLKSIRERASWKDLLYKASKQSSLFVELDATCAARLKRVEALRPMLFCLNQSPSTPAMSIELAGAFLDKYFPEKSPFELSA